MANDNQVVRKSFRDPASAVLKAHGYMSNNEVGDLEREERDDFSLQPGFWVLVGSEWVKADPGNEVIIAWPGFS